MVKIRGNTFEGDERVTTISVGALRLQITCCQKMANSKPIEVHSRGLSISKLERKGCIHWHLQPRHLQSVPEQFEPRDTQHGRASQGSLRRERNLCVSENESRQHDGIVRCPWHCDMEGLGDSFNIMSARPSYGA